MKNLFYCFLTLLLCCFLSIDALNAQTCNDPNAYNSGEMGTCQTCFDFVQNGDETGVDCGGSYPGCPTCPLSILSSVTGDNDNNFIYSTVTNTGNGGAGLWLLSGDNTEGSTTVLFRNVDGLSPRYWAIGNDRTDGNKFKIFPSPILEGTTAGFVIDRDFNVGIGTNEPDADLHILGRTHCNLTGEDARVLTLGIQRSWSFMQYGTDSNTALRLFCEATNKNFLISTDGNVSIGTIDDDLTPDYKLEVNGTAGKPGGGSWSNSSDRRLKKDIEDFTDGLPEILKIRPVWYRYNGKYGLPMDEKYVGVIAQEIQEVAPYTVTPYIETDDKTGETGEYLSYNGTAVTYMLVNAAQEQQAIIEDLKQEKDHEIAGLKSQINDLKKMVEALVTDKTVPSSLQSNDTGKNALSKDNLLFQNRPNPFTHQTTIHYNIPKTTIKATIHITDLSGKILNSYPINGTGTGNITVQGSTFAAGIYMYSLDLDGELVATKKMVLTK